LSFTQLDRNQGLPWEIIEIMLEKTTQKQQIIHNPIPHFSTLIEVG
jgi:hypothetical protein